MRTPPWWPTPSTPTPSSSAGSASYTSSATPSSSAAPNSSATPPSSCTRHSPATRSSTRTSTPASRRCSTSSTWRWGASPLSSTPSSVSQPTSARSLWQCLHVNSCLYRQGSQGVSQGMEFCNWPVISFYFAVIVQYYIRLNFFF